MTSLQTLELGIGFHENKLHYLTGLVKLRKLTYIAYIEECGDKYANIGEARERMIECFTALNNELPELAEVNVKMTRWKDDLAEILRPDLDRQPNPVTRLLTIGTADSDYIPIQSTIYTYILLSELGEIESSALLNLFAGASYPCDVGGDRLSAGGRLRQE